MRLACIYIRTTVQNLMRKAFYLLYGVISIFILAAGLYFMIL